MSDSQDVRPNLPDAVPAQKASAARQNEIDFARASWDALAKDWYVQVGEQGDQNRFYNSDPVLWRLAGEVRGKRVLDAGSGTGYLSRQLAERGAKVTGVDFSSNMVQIALEECKDRYPELTFRMDSISELRTCADQEFDLIVSNYVLMDTPELEAAVASFYRVLAPGGVAVVIFSHPCFPAGRATTGKGDAISYHFPESYFERARIVEGPWAHFKDNFVWYHRPLEDYFRAFTQAGFQVTALEEPHLTRERAHLIPDKRMRRKYSTRSYSIAFRLLKP